MTDLAPADGRRAFLAGLTALTATAAGAGRGLQARPVPTVATYPLLRDPPASHRVMQRDVEVDGLGYRLSLAIPTGTAPAAGWPSLWMLDGNAVFNRLTAPQLATQPGLAVVCIGYPVETELAPERRTLDYTPVPHPGVEDPRALGRATGGAAAFRARLTGPLRALATEGWSHDPASRSLWGHSFGGLFTLGTLFVTPDAFHGYVAVSPSTGFGGGVLAEQEAAARLVAAPGTRLHILLGDSDRSGDTSEAGPDLATMAMAGRLARRGDLEVQVDVLRGLSHGETFCASFPDALDVAAHPAF